MFYLIKDLKMNAEFQKIQLNKGNKKKSLSNISSELTDTSKKIHFLSKANQ